MRESEGYENLASAIVVQAAKDYRQALAALKRNNRNRTARATKEEVEEFFTSGWFMQLTDVDGSFLIAKLQEEAEYYER